MSKATAYDSCRVSRGGDIIPRLMLPHDVRNVVKPVYRPVGSDQEYELIIETGVPVDNQFSSPKQIRWSAALGKLLVAQNASSLGYYGLRNEDLSFFSKFCGTNPYTPYAQCVDSDPDYIYIKASTTASLYKLNKTTFATVGIGAGFNGARMIDAQLPNHILVTSTNAADGHGLRLVRKSDMTVVASILSTGAGDGQFNNPLGVFYHDGFAYVADYSNNRIVKVAVTTTLGAEALTWDSNITPIWTDIGAQPSYDLCTDGTNWYITISNFFGKFDMSFNLVQMSTFSAAQGYSLTLIPDQGDGNGATLAVCSNANSNIKRHKCSDLSLINTVGSAGDGSASKFDPTFTTSVATRITYQMDDGWQYTTPLGTSHAISWNGFDGYSFRNAGPHRCTVRVEGGLGLVTGIDCNTDFVSILKNLIRCNNLTILYGYSNDQLVLDLSQIPKRVQSLQLAPISGTTNLITGDISALPSTLTYLNLTSLGSICGTLPNLPNATTYYFVNCASIVGSLSNINAVAMNVRLYSSINITPASIAHIIAIHDLRIYSMSWLQAGVDLVIDSAWQARMSYTYMTGPSLQIGGTNAAPTGNYIAPAEGADWHNDGSKWIPLTGKAKAYDLAMNVNSEVRPTWAVTFTA